MALKFYLGLTSFVLSFFAVFLNVLIFRPVFRLAFIEKKSSIYIIAFFNIISDLLQLFIVCLYLSPNIMQNDYILTGSQTSVSNIFVGWIFVNAWYIECFVQVVMAVNRVCIITLKKYNIFTFKFTVIILIALLILTSTLATLKYIFPCCPYVIQFVFISVFYVCTWVFFEVFPRVVPDDKLEYFWVIALLVTLNASSNSVIFLTCNKDVKRSINFPWAKNKIHNLTVLP